VRAGGDVRAAAVVTAHQPGEQEFSWVATPQRAVLVAAAHDLLRLLERVLVDERFVQAGVGVAVPADEAAATTLRVVGHE